MRLFVLYNKFSFGILFELTSAHIQPPFLSFLLTKNTITVITVHACTIKQALSLYMGFGFSLFIH